MMFLLPILLLLGGTATIAGVLIASQDEDQPVPDHPPDLPSAPLGRTRWAGVNAILDELRKAATASMIPLGLLVGWIAHESGGLLEGWGSPRAKLTKYNERGFFQLMPDESKSLGLDHDRLSTDPQYSINAGLALIARYEGVVDRMAAATPGSALYFLLVKLVHTIGPGNAEKWVKEAQADGAMGSWQAFSSWALDHDSSLLHETKHSPKKWIPFLQKIYDTGRPFGFGSDSPQTVVGAELPYSDIIDPLDVLQAAG